MDTPERRTKLLELIWDHAYMAIEGPDSQGAPIDPNDVWKRFKENIASVGLELDVRPIDEDAADASGIPLSLLLGKAATKPPIEP